MPPIDLGQYQLSAEMVPSQTEKTRCALRESSPSGRIRWPCSPSSISSNLSSSSSQGSSDSAKSSRSMESKSNKQMVQNQSLTTKGFKRHYATHNYQDFSRVKPSQADLDLLQGSRGGVPNPFPTVLQTMMEKSDEKGYSNIISWQSHGRAFLIHQPKTFVADVLPLFFKHSKLSSFQRQLSLYGFIRLTHDGPDRGAYYHPCFLRGRSFLTSNITRTRVKGTWVRTSSSPELEPDFYQMEPVRAPGLDTDIQAPPALVSSSPIKSTDYTCHTLLQDDDGEADQDRSYKIHPFLHNAIRTSSVLYSDRTTLMSSQVPPTTSVQLLDAHTVKDDSTLQMNQPAADAGLQPPPPFPNTFVSGIGQPISSDNGFFPSTAFFPASTTSAGDSASLALNDDDLAVFLTDIDLEDDFFEHNEHLVNTW
jgi:hypothetical protein